MKTEWSTGYKQRQVKVTLSEAELEELTMLAEMAGLSLSDFFRRKARLSPIKRGRRQKEEQDVRTENSN